MNLVYVIWFPIVSHPFLILLLVPNNSNLFLPKQNLSIMSYTSEGFDSEPDYGYYVITTSMSMLGWIKLLSNAFFESPL